MLRFTRPFAAALLLAVPAVAHAQEARSPAKKAGPALDLRRQGRRRGAGQGRDRPGPAGRPPRAGHVRRRLVRLVPQAPRPLRLRPGDPPAARRRVRPGPGRHRGAPRRRPAGRMPRRPDAGGLPLPGRPRRAGQGRHPPGDRPAGGGRPPRPGQGEGLPGGVGRAEGRGVEGPGGGPGAGVERGQARLPPLRRPQLRVVPPARRLPGSRGHGGDPRPRVRGRQGRPRPDDRRGGDPQEISTRRSRAASPGSCSSTPGGMRWSPPTARRGTSATPSRRRRSSTSSACSARPRGSSARRRSRRSRRP